jgi:hypothetical protein
MASTDLTTSCRKEVICDALKSTWINDDARIVSVAREERKREERETYPFLPVG